MTDPLVELKALEHLDSIDSLAAYLKGRTWLTPQEARLLYLDKQYMAECQTRAFRIRWGEAFAQVAYIMAWKPRPNEDRFPVNEINVDRRVSWVASRSNLPRDFVAYLLKRIESLFRYRALLELDDDPPVDDFQENRYQNSGAA